MNAILGFSSLLNDPELSRDKQLMYTRIISDRTNVLLSVLNDILDISKMESGIVLIKERPGTIASLFEELEKYAFNQLSNNKAKKIVVRSLNKVDPNPYLPILFC